MSQSKKLQMIAVAILSAIISYGVFVSIYIFDLGEIRAIILIIITLLAYTYLSLSMYGREKRGKTFFSILAIGLFFPIGLIFSSVVEYLW